MRWIFLTLLLYGCAPSENSNHGLGWGYDFQGPTGTRIRYINGRSIYYGGPPPTIEHTEDLFNTVKECVRQHYPTVNVNAPGPLIIFLESVDELAGTPTQGATFFDTGTIIIEPENPVLSYEYLITHEFTHWITFWAGILTEEQERNHDPPSLFNDCRYI